MTPEAQAERDAIVAMWFAQQMRAVRMIGEWMKRGDHLQPPPE